LAQSAVSCFVVFSGLKALLAGLNLVTLPREFFSQFFFGRQVQHIFRGKHPLALVQCGVASYNLVLLRSQDQSYGWIVPLATLEFVEHAQVHIHLPYVLVFQAADFHVDQHEAFK
jgi:hypothetical protein